MQSLARKPVWIAGAALVAILFAGFGFSRYRSAQTKQAQEQAQIRQIGADWQQEGLLSQQDYVTLRGFASEVVRTRSLSDGDLDWLLSTMARSSSAIVHARVLGILCALSNPPAAQKMKIKAGIAPMLRDGNILDERYARRVQQKLSLSA
jgi:hypothetical protein